MTISARAKIVMKDGAKHTLILHQTAPTVFQWGGLANLVAFAPAHYVCRHDAIKALRLAFETEVSLIGCDLTINAAEQPPHIRAAQRLHDETFETVDELAELILDETNIADLLEHVGVLLAYLIRTGRQPKPPGLDMAEAGLILNVIESIEKAEKCDLGNLKKTLTADVTKVQVYSSMPPKGGVQ